jgi:hypothetical protein
MSQKSILEKSLISAMQALDKQILRAVSSRNPEKLERHGVQKWEPISERVEMVATLILDKLGDNHIELDSVLVLSQALSKVLQLVAEDLGRDGLGELRTAYLKRAFELITDSALRGEQALGDAPLLS